MISSDYRQDSQPRQRALLLQGPVGWFFKSLQTELIRRNFDVKRVLFNSADAIYASRKNVVRFSGSLDDWQRWLKNEFSVNPPDIIILFGSNRPVHTVARELAKIHDIKVLSLEEGYLRSGYITCEVGGNNQHSMLSHSMKDVIAEGDVPQHANVGSSFYHLVAQGMIYYLWRDFTESEAEKQLYHRVTNTPLVDSIIWTRRMMRYWWAKIFEYRARRQILSGKKGHYIFVPLQTPGDSQLRIASRGWSNNKLVRETLRAVKETGSDLHVIFKTHPLDVNSHIRTRNIKRIAAEQGMTQKTTILDSGMISLLTEHSSGMITINSTCGFSALGHGKPLLVLGDAVFRHENIATIGNDASSIDEFFRLRAPKPNSSIESFFARLKKHALLPGDFYLFKGRKIAAQSVAKKAEDQLAVSPLNKAYCSR